MRLTHDERALEMGNVETIISPFYNNVTVWWSEAECHDGSLMSKTGFSSSKSAKGKTNRKTRVKNKE